MKSNLKDLTFLLPIRIDSVNRLENVVQVVRFLQKQFYTHIIVLEASYYNNQLLKKLLPKQVEYYFIEDKDPVFHRTKFLNIMTRKVKTDFLAIWDVDVITLSHQISDSMEALRSREFDISFPYNKSFMDVTDFLKIAFINSNGNMDVLSQNVDKMM